MFAAVLLIGAVSVTVVPAQPLLERTLYGQAMNCDFRIANRGSQALELRVVQLAVRDAGGALIAQLEINDNGIQPGITIVPQRKIAPGAQLTLFNPFHTLAAQWPLASLDYTFRFGDEKEGEVVEKVHVVPKAYATRTKLRLRWPPAGLGRAPSLPSRTRRSKAVTVSASSPCAATAW